MPRLRDRRRVELRDVARPRSSIVPGGGAPQAHDGAQHGGLAGAVAAQQHGQLAARHGEVHALQDVVLADMRVHAGQREEASGTARLPR